MNHSKTVRVLPRVVMLALLIAVLSLQLGNVFAQEPLPLPAPAQNAAQIQAQNDEIRAAIAAEGQALVYVGFDTGTTAMRSFNTFDTAAIMSTQDAVMAALPMGSYRLQWRYETIPGMAVWVNSTGLEALRSNAQVSDVVLSREMTTSNTQAANLMQVPSVWQNLGFSGEGVRVAVVDTGVDGTHPDLASRMIGSRCFFSPDTSLCPGGEAPVAPDDDGHDTHVAGTIASRGQIPGGERGMAPDASIYGIKVLGAQGGTGADLLKAIDWMAANKATLQIDIINMSLGFDVVRVNTHCDTMDTFLSAVKTAIDNTGAVTVVAAGNNGDANNISFPACLSNVISVGAVYSSNFGGVGFGNCQDSTTAADKVTCFSQAGPILDVMGPGAMLTSTVPGGGYDDFGGTSMASPAVAGVVALMLDKNPNLTNTQVESILKQTGVMITDHRSGAQYPRVNALAAVNAVPGGQNPGGPAPANDNFANAVNMNFPYFSTTTAIQNATEEAAEPGYSCHSAGAGLKGSRSVWFKFTVAQAGKFSASTAGSTYTPADPNAGTNDTIMGLYTGSSLAALTEVACNDDINAQANQFLSHFVDVPLSPNTYYLRVSYWNAREANLITGTLNLNATFTPDDNGGGNPGTNLITDGGLETGAGWGLAKGTRDVLKCNTATKTVSRSGNCAFMFRGSVGENSRLRTRVSKTSITPTINDILNFEIYMNATNPLTDIMMLVKINYTDGTAPSRLRGTFGQTNGYTRIHGNMLVQSAAVHQITFSVSNRSLRGKVYLDDASMVLVDASGLNATAEGMWMDSAPQTSTPVQPNAPVLDLPELSH